MPQLNSWLDNDPFGSQPANKLAFLKDAEEWSTTVGHPGPANAAIGEVFDTFILPQMMARAARGEMSARDAVVNAENQIRPIFSSAGATAAWSAGRGHLSNCVKVANISSTNAS